MKTETIEGFVPARKPYQPPRLVAYGKLQDLTRGNANGNSDASGKSML